MNYNKIIVRTKRKLYPIYFGDGILTSVGMLIRKNMPRVKKFPLLVIKKNLRYY